MNFQKILDKYREIAFSERDKGDRFERLMQAYLQTDPTYANLFNYVWLWNEFPSKMDFVLPIRPMESENYYISMLKVKCIS